MLVGCKNCQISYALGLTIGTESGIIQSMKTEQEMMIAIEALPVSDVLDSVRRCGGEKLANSGIELENILFDFMSGPDHRGESIPMIDAVIEDLGLT